MGTAGNGPKEEKSHPLWEGLQGEGSEGKLPAAHCAAASGFPAPTPSGCAPTSHQAHTIPTCQPSQDDQHSQDALPAALHLLMVFLALEKQQGANSPSLTSVYHPEAPRAPASAYVSVGTLASTSQCAWHQPRLGSC